jgi:hypothetical protein
MENLGKQQAKSLRKSKVLSEYLPGCTLLLYRKTDWSDSRTSAANMDSLRFGEEHYALASLVKAVTPIDIFAIHEEFFIQGSHFIQGLPPHKPEPTHENVNVCGNAVIEVQHEVAFKKV